MWRSLLMRRALAAIMAATTPLAVWAQTSGPIVSTPLPPSGQPPGPTRSAPTPTAPPRSAPPPTAATAGQSQPSGTPQPTATPWLPQGNAVLQVLDKVNAQSTVMTVKVGQAARAGTLTIQVLACNIRPPDQPQDATAFLTITDGRADTAAFSGWIVAGNPSLSMLQHPIYDVRVIGCKA